MLKPVERVKIRRLALAYLGGHIIVERSVVDHASMIDALRAGGHEHGETQ